MKPKKPDFWDSYNPKVEQLNKFLYPSKQKAYGLMKLVSNLNIIFGIALVLYAYGFNLPKDELAIAFFATDISLGVFLLIYLLRILFSFRRADFLKRTWFEGFLMLLIALNGFSHIIFNIRIIEQLLIGVGIQEPYEFYRIGLMFFMLLLLLVEGVKLTTRFSNLQLKPATTFIGSFLLLVLIGAGLLMMPALSRSGTSLNFTDALFTSVSASCVTGLTVVDTAQFFSLKGQIVILILIQLGGLGIVTFATFFATFIRKGVGLKHQSIIQDFLSAETLGGSKGLLRQIIGITFGLELFGAMLIYFSWGPEVKFTHWAEKAFYSLFHAISAFCNAGFSVFENGITNPLVQQGYLFQLMICALIILGGIGIPVIQDVLSIPKMRERMKYPWKEWKLGSKIAIYTSILLIAFGMMWFYVLEYHSLMAGKRTGEKLLISFFTIVNTRTSGFNSLDLALLSAPSVILLVFLMFVGASPGSTGGGIKTTTFYLILITALATIKGEKSISIDKRSISNELIFKAFAVFTFAVSFNIIAIFLLTITESGISIERLVFEQFSAFGTVGLSMGVTPLLSTTGKVIIILSMFVGRVGLLTLALALSNKVISTSYKYPSEHIMVA